MPLLEPFADEVWTVTRKLRFYGVDTGARMTVVRLSSGSVLIHSPGPLTPALQDEIAALGTVTAIVAPSSFHHLHVQEWRDAYPDAKLGCCPDLVKKRSDVSFDCVLGDQPEPEWHHDLAQVHFSARTMEDEVVFHHPGSRTLICCDAIFNLSVHPSRLTRLTALALANTKPGATWLEHVMMRKHRQAGREQVERMLCWDFDRIVLSHGAMIEAGGHDIFRRAYRWL